MPRTRIKMCGTTNLMDLKVAVEVGVDALGFIFFEKSPRNIHPLDARKLIQELPPFINRVGVFVDRDITEVKEIVNLAGLSHLQLHGNESPKYCENLLLSMPKCQLIKAFRVSPDTKKDDFAPYREVVSGFLLDTFSQKAVGGTGHTFDWSHIPKLQLQLPFILAGGLNPQNIEEAIKNVQPFGIDINSGVESKPGVKDHAKLRLLAIRARGADDNVIGQ